ncbi:hypothetical protein DFAR_2390001 [Desulfarculales bacterium]
MLLTKPTTSDAFGAPALIFVPVPTDQTPYVILDAMAFITALCLAALARYPKVVRQHLHLPDDERLLMGLALGFPDASEAVNQSRDSRTGLEKTLPLTGL